MSKHALESTSTVQPVKEILSKRFSVGQFLGGLGLVGAVASGTTEIADRIEDAHRLHDAEAIAKRFDCRLIGANALQTSFAASDLWTQEELVVVVGVKDTPAGAQEVLEDVYSDKRVTWHEPTVKAAVREEGRSLAQSPEMPLNVTESYKMHTVLPVEHGLLNTRVVPGTANRGDVYLDYNLTVTTTDGQRIEMNSQAHCGGLSRDLDTGEWAIDDRHMLPTAVHVDPSAPR